MFDKFKQLKQLKQLQDEIKKETASAEQKGVKVVVNGSMKIEEIKLNPDLKPEQQQQILKDCINEAMEKIKGKFSEKMMDLRKGS